jgi:hypothetical protein
VGDVEDRVGDRRRLREELVRLRRVRAARPRHVDHGVDDDVRDVDAVRPEAARHRLRQDALRRLRRRERRETRRSPPRRRVARDHDRAAAGVAHGRHERLPQVHQRQDVRAERLLEVLRRHVHEAAEVSADRVVHEHGGRPQVGADTRNDVVDRGAVRHVDGEAAAAVDLALERREPLGVARQHRDTVAARGEAPAQRRAGARADTGDDADLRAAHDGVQVPFTQVAAITECDEKNDAPSQPLYQCQSPAVLVATAETHVLPGC